MKIFYWKPFIKKMKLKNFIGLLIAVIITSISTYHLFNEYGLYLVFQSFALSYLYDKFKDFIKAIKYVNDHYTSKTH